jgi:hypothetical protein
MTWGDKRGRMRTRHPNLRKTFSFTIVLIRNNNSMTHFIIRVIGTLDLNSKASLKILFVICLLCVESFHLFHSPHHYSPIHKSFKERLAQKVQTVGESYSASSSSPSSGALSEKASAHPERGAFSSERRSTKHPPIFPKSKSKKKVFQSDIFRSHYEVQLFHFTVHRGFDVWGSRRLPGAGKAMSVHGHHRQDRRCSLHVGQDACET